MARRYWTCRRCSHRNLRSSSRKCQGCAGLTKPKKRIPKHKEIIRGDTYHLFVKFAEDVHGVTDESCCVCRKPRAQSRRHDRDHDHVHGRIRGLACGGDSGCNILMMRWISAATAKGIWTAKKKASEPDAGRWKLIYEYLDRVEVFYSQTEEEE